MCTGFEYALLASSVASTGSALHAANTAPKAPKLQQGEKAPVVRQRRPARGATSGGAANSSFGLLNVGAPTLLGG